MQVTHGAWVAKDETGRMLRIVQVGADDVVEAFDKVADQLPPFEWVLYLFEIDDGDDDDDAGAGLLPPDPSQEARA